MRPLGLVVALVVLGACTDAPDPQPAPQPAAGGTTAGPSSPPSTGAATTTPGPTTSGTGWDCAAVDQAREDLADTTNAELARLEIDRSDPRAFGVQVLVAAQQGLEYWSTVRDAVPATEAALRSDAEAVVEYWSRVDADLDAIQVGSGDDASLGEATRRYLEVMAEHPEEEVLPVQERLTAGVETACTAASS